MTEITLPDPAPEPNGARLAAQRRMTTAFINVLPLSVVLVPRSKTKTPTGGYTWQDQEPRPPQIMTLIEPTGNPRPTVTVDGQVREVEFVLLAEHDAQLAADDTFTHQGKDWRVVSLLHDNGWERRATVVARG